MSLGLRTFARLPDPVMRTSKLGLQKREQICNGPGERPVAICARNLYTESQLTVCAKWPPLLTRSREVVCSGHLGDRVSVRAPADVINLSQCFTLLRAIWQTQVSRQRAVAPSSGGSANMAPPLSEEELPVRLPSAAIAFTTQSSHSIYSRAI